MKKDVIAKPLTGNKSKTFSGGNVLNYTNSHGSFFNLIVERSIDILSLYASWGRQQGKIARELAVFFPELQATA
jgi:hypothetical protein